MPYGFEIDRSEGDTLTLQVYLSSRRVDVRPQLLWIVMKRRRGGWRVRGFLPAANPIVVPGGAKR